MSEQNRKAEVLSEIESFIDRLDWFGEDESRYNSEAIKSLNDLIEKCKVYANQFKLERKKTFGSHGNRGPNVDNIGINIDDFNIKKILPMVGQIWSEYGESLTDKMAAKLFRFLELSLECCGAEPISIAEVQKIFELGRSVLKSKINFTDEKSILYISGVFEKLIEIMLKSNLSDSEMLKIFDMLCDISFNHGDKVSCSAAIMRKKRVVFDVLKKCFLPWNYCKLKDIISVVAERVWDQAKIALNNDGNEITEQNAAGVIEGIFSILDGILQNMLEDEDIVDKNIVNIKIVNTDFKTILELAKNTLKQSLPTDKNFLCGWTYAQALHVIWDMNLLMMSEEQREQMDEMLKSLGLGSKNGEIVVIDEKVFNSLPSCSYINDAIEEAKDCAQSHYTAQVRNGNKIVEVNKTDDKDKNRQDNEYQKNNRENQYKKTEEIKNEKPMGVTTEEKKVDNVDKNQKHDNDVVVMIDAKEFLAKLIQNNVNMSKITLETLNKHFSLSITPQDVEISIVEWLCMCLKMLFSNFCTFSKKTYHVSQHLLLIKYFDKAKSELLTQDKTQKTSLLDLISKLKPNNQQIQNQPGLKTKLLQNDQNSIENGTNLSK